MYLNIRALLVLCLMFFTAITYSQTKEENEETRKSILSNPSGAFINLSYFQPQFYANDFLGEGYDFGGGLDIEFGWIAYNFTLQFNLNVISGDVVRPDLVGNIRSANFTRLSVGVGYIVELTRKFNIHPSAYLGLLKLGQNIDIGSGKIRDSGSFVALGLSLNYEIIPWLEIALGAKQYFDFFNINAAPQDQSFFDNSQSIYPSLGIRFKLTNQSLIKNQ